MNEINDFNEMDQLLNENERIIWKGRPERHIVPNGYLLDIIIVNLLFFFFYYFIILKNEIFIISGNWLFLFLIFFVDFLHLKGFISILRNRPIHIITNLRIIKKNYYDTTSSIVSIINTRNGKNLIKYEKKVAWFFIQDLKKFKIMKKRKYWSIYFYVTHSSNVTGIIKHSEVKNKKFALAMVFRKINNPDEIKKILLESCSFDLEYSQKI